MKILLFQNRFEQPILDGVKTCTIRAPRKDGRPHVVEGETVSLRVWTGKPYRSKTREFCQRKIKFTFPVCIACGITREDTLDPLVPKFMAKVLGFYSWQEAKAWYRSVHGLPFKGVLINFSSPL